MPIYSIPEDFIGGVIPASIVKKIEESKSILLLKYNWDDNGAVAISKIAFQKAVDFLKNYSVRILDVYSKDLIVPEIAAVKDGSVDLEWNLNNSYLLINFTASNEDFVYYYLAFRDGDNIVFDANGQIETQKTNDKFASYLVDLS